MGDDMSIVTYGVTEAGRVTLKWRGAMSALRKLAAVALVLASVQSAEALPIPATPR